MCTKPSSSAACRRSPRFTRTPLQSQDPPCPIRSNTPQSSGFRGRHLSFDDTGELSDVPMDAEHHTNANAASDGRSPMYGHEPRALSSSEVAKSLQDVHGLAGSKSGAVLLESGQLQTGAEKVRISLADELSKVYCFVSQIPVRRIRLVLKGWDWRVNGKKDVLVAKVILHLKLAILSGKTLEESFLSHEETSRYQSWLRMRLCKDDTYPVSIDKVPDEKDLVASLPAVEANEYHRRKKAIRQPSRAMSIEKGHCAGLLSAGAAEAVPAQDTHDHPAPAVHTTNTIAEGLQFGLNAFARLMITIREDEDARCAVISMGQELTRAQLDAGVTRWDFWVVVESRFNDPANCRHLNLGEGMVYSDINIGVLYLLAISSLANLERFMFSNYTFNRPAGHLDGVDSSLPPLAYRTATFLKDKFNDAKADFTQYIIRWSASGQNDPERFSNFLPKLASGDLNALGKRMMVMFVCTRKGTPHEEMHFSNVCCKLIPGGAGRDEGSRTRKTSTADVTTETQRGRKRHSESDGVREIASSLSKIASCFEGKRSSKEGDGSEKQLKDYFCRLKKIKILEDVVKGSGIWQVPAEMPVTLAAALEILPAETV